MRTTAEKLSLYLDRFSEAARRCEGEPDWLRRRRKSALARFLELGVPTPRDEEYKYTNLSRLAGGDLLFGRARGEAAAGLPRYVAGQGASIAFAGSGRGSEVRGSLPDGVSVRGIAAALRSEPSLLEGRLASAAPVADHALCALNTAFFEDGAVIEVAPGVVAADPIHVTFGAGPVGRHPRVLILAGRNSSVRVVETYLGTGTYWRNAVTEIFAGENARVEHVRAQIESPQAFHTGMLQAMQKRDSCVNTFSLSFGAAVARNDIRTRLNGTGCECALDGLYAVSGRQHVDHHTAIDHAMPHCHSHQLYKGVLDEHARGVFNGKIFVRRDAQKTDAVQSNKNLLLSDSAEVNTKPQLEIDANDVRCTHGATVGQLDSTAAFYLRSRGIGAAQARNILTYAFAADALERIGIAPVREYFEARLLERFAPAEG